MSSSKRNNKANKVPKLLITNKSIRKKEIKKCVNDNDSNDNNKSIRKIKKEIKKWKKRNRTPKNAQKVKNYFKTEWVDPKGNLIGIEPQRTRVCDFLINLGVFGYKNNLITNNDKQNVEFIAWMIKKSGIEEFALFDENELYYFIRDDIQISDDDFEEVEPYIKLIGAAIIAYNNNFNCRDEIYRTIFFHYPPTKWCFNPKICEWNNDEERETGLWQKLT